MNNLSVYEKRFVAGVNIEDAITVVEKLNKNAILATLDILGEDILSHKDVQESCQEYIRLIKEIKKAKVSSYISVKLSMLGLCIDYNFCRDQLLQILEIAEKLKIFVRIDIEYSQLKEKTFALFYEVKKRFHYVGLVVQAALHSSYGDVQELIVREASLRLCKGAYKENSSQAIQDKEKIRENFLRLTMLLLEKGNQPAFATHDSSLIEEIKTIAKNLGRDPQSFEFQMLYGFCEEQWSLLIEEGYRLRIYVPFGEAWQNYVSRRK